MLDFFNAARTRRHTARVERLERQQLRADLGSYTTEADIFDLEATLDRYPDEQTLEIRRMLVHQAVS